MPRPRLSSRQVSQLTDWVAIYIADQRSHFLTRAKPIGSDQVAILRAFFPEDVLCTAKVVRGRASEPPFYSQLRAMGISNAPPFSDMAGITFEDVIVHVEPLETSLLFHELVHAVQYKHLGLDRFAERYVRGFLTRGSYEEIPLEQQAYQLEDKFVQDPSTSFSVEADVIERIRRHQF
jgi:hypothetical protein